MKTKIYKKAFIKESEAAITKIDDALAFVEDGIGELQQLFNKLTSGNVENLEQLSATTIGDYQDTINRMDNALTNLYSYKNTLLDNLKEMK